MAKKETKAPATPEAATPKAKGPAIERGLNDRFVRVMGADKKPVAPTGKLAPQAQVIINVIEALGAKGGSRSEVVSALGDGTTGPLKTRQPAGRILSYYQKTIVESGAVKHEKVADADAAAKAPAAA